MDDLVVRDISTNKMIGDRLKSSSVVKTYVELCRSFRKIRKEKAVLLKIDVRAFLYALFFIAFMFTNAIEQSFSIFSWMDEVVAILALIYFILYIASGNTVPRGDGLIIFLVVLLSIIAFIGNSISGVQQNIIYQLYDAFNIFKYVFIVLGGIPFFSHMQDKQIVIEYISFAVKIAILISTIFMVINLFADVGMYTDYRYGLRAYNFIFSRVGGMYDACILWLIILTADLYYDRRKSNKVFIVLALLNMASTLRSRAFAFVLIYICVYYVLLVRKKKEFSCWYVIPVGFVLFFAAQDQISFYFSGDTARSVLLRYGIVTARTYFPFGSGFGTYGTAVARDHYSSLYSTYHFSKYYGLQSDGGGFLTDNFWPAIMGEFGFIGTVLMAILIGVIIKKFYMLADNEFSKVCVVFAFGTLIIASVATSSFLACTRLMTFTALVLCMRSDNGDLLEDGEMYQKNYRECCDNYK